MGINFCHQEDFSLPPNVEMSQVPADDLQSCLSICFCPLAFTKTEPVAKQPWSCPQLAVPRDGTGWPAVTVGAHGLTHMGFCFPYQNLGQTHLITGSL